MSKVNDVNKVLKDHEKRISALEALISKAMVESDRNTSAASMSLMTALLFVTKEF